MSQQIPKLPFCELVDTDKHTMFVERIALVIMGVDKSCPLTLTQAKSSDLLPYKDLCGKIIGFDTSILLDRLLKLPANLYCLHLQPKSAWKLCCTFLTGGWVSLPGTISNASLWQMHHTTWSIHNKVCFRRSHKIISAKIVAHIP